jgi:DNA-binding GntR family transcriptional regulator
VLAGGNRRIGRAFEPLWEETERVLHHTGLLRRHPDELRHDHRPLLAALKSGDGAAAEAEMREEIQHLSRIVIDIALKTAILPAPPTDAEAERSEDARW